MRTEALSETKDLEAWIVAHPEVLDATLKIVTTQFARWQSDSGAASERLDLLALAQSGELVVIELKLEKDRNIHLQGITYAALVSGFTAETLASAHSDWLSKNGEPTTHSEALNALRDHVGEFDEELLQLPRVILVAESFPSQVITTVQWLSKVASQLQIECHTYTVFSEAGLLSVAFDRLYPVNDLADQFLTPRPSDVNTPQDRLESNRRQAKSVTRIHEAQAIPEGARVELVLKGQARPELITKVNSWLDEDSRRREVTWSPHRSRPLVWAVDPDPNARYTPSALRDAIFAASGVPKGSSSAADAWSFKNKTLYQVANESQGPVSVD